MYARKIGMVCQRCFDVVTSKQRCYDVKTRCTYFVIEVFPRVSKVIVFKVSVVKLLSSSGPILSFRIAILLFTTTFIVISNLTWIVLNHNSIVSNNDSIVFDHNQIVSWIESSNHY